MIPLRLRSLTAALLTFGTLVPLLTAGPAQAAGSGSIPAEWFHGSLHAAAIGAVRHPDASQRVIVILRDQPAATGRSPRALALRSDAIATAQSPVVARLSALHARHLHAYHFVDAVAATVTRQQAAELAADPQVRAVVPDRRVTLPAAAPATTPAASTPADRSPNAEPAVCPASGTQNEPQALSLMHADAAALPAGIDGRHVRIAVFPDGLDPTLADLQRPNGSSVVTDYRDFTGEGTAAKTGGGEAFGDVSSIGAQGKTTYDLSQYVNPALRPSGPCDITITGAAPGAKIDVMKVFGSTDSTFDSVLLQGMDWAVSHDHADVLSESFGANSVSQPTNDPISLFNQEAVAHGVVVVTSSGDSGTSNTIGSPASSSRAGIISVGASTALRAAAQIGLYSAPVSNCWSACPVSQGWQDDNVASLSSAGTTEYGPRTVDVMAPGDAGWALCSSDTSQYTDCSDPFGGTPPRPAIQLFGGTSQSAPLTAATAALVIQAYEQAHPDAKPSPAFVKRAITSTAQPISGVPADEQGSGLVDAAAAVALAQHAPAAGTSGLLLGTDQIGRVGNPGRRSSVTIPVTNESNATETVTPSLTTFGPLTRLAGGRFTYDPADTSAGIKYPGPTNGSPVVADLEPVTVSQSLSRLVVRAAWSQGSSTAGDAVEVALIDPEGRIVNGSDPQGLAGFAEIEAAAGADSGSGPNTDPGATLQPGTWQVAIEASSTGYAGPVTWEADGQTATPQPAGSPVTLGAGSSRRVTVPFRFPTTAGDAASAIRLVTTTGGSAPVGVSQLPLLTRARIPVTSHHAGRFSGTLTGGNGRQFFYSQEVPYQFSVRRGAPGITADLTVAHSGYDILAYLVDPHGVAVDAQSTISGRTFRSTRSVHLTWLHPVAGQWHLVLALVGAVRSQRTATAFSGTLALTRPRVTVRGLAHSRHTVLRRGTRHTARITIRNPGSSTEYYFLDPRLRRTGVTPLAAVTRPSGRLPISNSQEIPVFLLPPFSSSLAVVAHATRPVALETYATDPSIESEGYPDVVSSGFHRKAQVGLRGDLAATGYACAPQVKGPTRTGVPRTNQFACDAAARSRAYAATLHASTGAPWRSLAHFHPVAVPPHSRRTMTVTIRPAGRAGQVVKGFVAVESFSLVTFGTDVAARVPFAYRTG